MNIDERQKEENYELCVVSMKARIFQFCHSTQKSSHPDLSYWLEDLAQKTELLIYFVNGKCESYEKPPSEAPHARYSCNKWAPRSWKFPQYSNPQALHLELLEGQPHSMNKVVLQVDITYSDKKIFLILLVPILGEAVLQK